MSPPFLQDRIRAAVRWRPGRLARQSTGLLGWMVLRAGTQAATVLMLARTLGSSGYGQFVATLAVASFLVPFVGLGLNHMVLRNGSKDPAHLSDYVAQALRWWILSLGPAVMLGIAGASILLPSDLPRAAAWAAIAAELIASSLVELCGRQAQSCQNAFAFGAINAGLPAVRLILLAALTVCFPASAEAALWMYTLASLAYAASVATRLPWRSLWTPLAGQEPMGATSGLPLCLSAFALRVQGEYNKPLLAHMGYGLAGSYNVAQRLSELLAMPLLALQEALWPRLYAHASPATALRRLSAWMLGVATLCGAVVWLTAPGLPWILGDDFEAAVPIARLLAGLPLVQALRSIMNFWAIHQGRTALIGWACAAGAGASALSLTWLVPTLGAPGAVYVTYGAELLMTLWLLLGLQRKPTSPP